MFTENIPVRHRDKMIELIGNCNKCPLSIGRNQIVYGAGAEKPTLVLVGEAPGRTEDEGGEPFTGRSGAMLCTALEKLGFSRENNIYITNTCRCRPENNRTPKSAEIKSCLPYLESELLMLSPRIILTLGLVPSKALISNKFVMSEGHGKIYDTPVGKVMPTYHPAAVLRNPKLKEPFLTDLEKLRDIISY